MMYSRSCNDNPWSAESVMLDIDRAELEALVGQLGKVGQFGRLWEPG